MVDHLAADLFASHSLLLRAFFCFIPVDVAAIYEILQHWVMALNVIVEGFTFYPVFVAVPGKQRWVRIFHVNIDHTILAYCMTDLPAHVLDAKLFCCPVPAESISLLVWHKPFFILVQHGKKNPQQAQLGFFVEFLSIPEVGAELKLDAVF